MVKTRSRPGMTYLRSEQGCAIYRKHDPWDTTVRYWNGVEQKDGWDMVPEFANVMCMTCKKCKVDLYDYSKEKGMLENTVDYRFCKSCECVARCDKCARREFKCRKCRGHKR